MENAGYTNIVLIVADDLGYGDLGFSGNRYVSTPAVDQMASQGVVLTQHYTASPIGAPARASLLCGRYSHRTGAVGLESSRGLDRFSVQEATIADLFRSAGFATGMVGKWHNGLFDRRYHPNSRGFDEFVGFLNGGMDYHDWILEVKGQPLRADGRYLTDVFTEEATGFIRRHVDEPFFLYVAYNAPHSPLQAPEREVQNFRDGGRFNEAVCRLYAMIQRLDAGIGQIMAALEACGLDENTLVLFTSDNGPQLGTERLPDGRVFSLRRYNGPLRGMKQDVLEGGIRVPAIVRWPARLPAGACVDAMVHFCDWLPTLTAAAGVTARAPLPLDGADVLPVLMGESDSVCEQRFWQHNCYEPVPGCNAAMRDGPWKLYWSCIPEAMVKLDIDTVWYRGMFAVPHFEMPVDPSPVVRTLSAPGKPQLYNLTDDPSESENLALQYPDRVRTMQRVLASWFAEVNAERRVLTDVWRG